LLIVLYLIAKIHQRLQNDKKSIDFLFFFLFLTLKNELLFGYVVRNQYLCAQIK